MRLTTFLPFLGDLKNYTAKDLRADLVGALTVTPMAIPQAMAYALIAGVHPQYGIYTAIFPVIAAALWGSSRYLIAGPTNAISMVLFSSLATVSIGGVVASTMPEEVRMPYIFMIALLAGLIQIVMGLARLGELTNFISHSVMAAFVAGAALLIAAGQLNTVLGLSLPRAEGGFFPQIATTLASLDQTNPWSLGIAAGTVLLTILFRRISRRFPATLAALVVASCLSALLGAAAHGVKMVGPIPSVLPPLSLPQALDPEVWRALFFPALAVALLGTVESLTIAKQMASINRDAFDGSRELIGQGLGNIVAGLTSGLPGCGSFTRSALMFSSGGRTRFGAVFTGLLALPMLFLMAPLVSWLPMPALSGVLLLACVQMINVESLRLSFETTRSDRIVLLITLASTLIFDLERALFIGVILSLLLYIQRSSHPIVRKLSHNSPLLRDVPDRPRGLVVYSIEGSLFFGAIHELERKLTKLEKKEVRLIVLHITRVFWIDASGAHALMLFLERCYARSVPVILVVSNREVRETLRRAGMLKDLSEGFITNRLKDGINLGIDLLSRISCYQEEEADGVGTSCQIANHRPAPPSSAQDRAATGQKA
ncbi:MAG TPA: SulP family inorganic anion transporter [Candidatus Desulfovibrio intestinipullorum]|uniref:SulP family inorganic anion transporter n=1 Tax=Candidatus Desulfovibrio intestinipullorum TaxID=2838536 RepID=A0A9D1PZ67_9BACT|nr:SulP family inorganic anion transporter [Candidatus Desulfovibrio intestinipullorum]